MDALGPATEARRNVLAAPPSKMNPATEQD
jgi:hypothetical protein